MNLNNVWLEIWLLLLYLYSLCHRLKSIHARIVIYDMYKRKIFWEIKSSFVFSSSRRRIISLMTNYWDLSVYSVCIRFAHMIERNHSRHLIASENCVNISVFINHFVITLIFMLMFNKRRKFCVSTTSNMLSRVRLWLKQKSITCFNVCLNQSQKHAEMTMMNTRRWNKYFVNSIRFVRICVIKLFSALNKLSWNFKRFLKIWDDNATQSLRLFFV